MRRTTKLVRRATYARARQSCSPASLAAAYALASPDLARSSAFRSKVPHMGGESGFTRPYSDANTTRRTPDSDAARKILKACDMEAALSAHVALGYGLTAEKCTTVSAPATAERHAPLPSARSPRTTCAPSVTRSAA
eukprot:scaffold21248_cov24-Tisochrysis_lutea.AAC.2